MVEGFLLDAYPDPATGEMVFWVRAGRKALSFRRPFTPAFYVAGPEAALADLSVSLPVVPGVGAPAYEERLLGLSRNRRPVLRVPVKHQRRLVQVAQMVDARGEHRDFDLYDVDLRMSQRFFFETGLFPFARVQARGPDRVQVLDGAWDLDYPSPDLGACTLAATFHSASPIPRPGDPVASIRVDDVVIEGPEEDVLREAAALVHRLNPDVVYTRGGDRWMLAQLAARARATGVPDWGLGRERLDLPPRRGKSFHQYGRIKYRASTYPIPGRVHVDLNESFFFAESGLCGIVDLSRTSGIPLAELARLEAGTAVTAIQIDLAKREGRLIPWKKNRPETPKTLRRLVAADRGGYIFDPAVGLHEDVIELDFASLYPSLIANHNLGSEAILCGCCDPATRPLESFVPQVGYHVCERRGLVPRALKRLVERRAELKRRRGADPKRRAEYQGRIDALKWLNVVSFGYQGYRNARFGSIEGHEATCAWGREALLTASEVARDHGHEVLHGIVDSLWLTRVNHGASDPETLAAAVERATGIRFEFEGRYKWIVFLPTRMHAASSAPPIGAINRFYGCFDRVPDAPSRSQAGQDADYLAGGALKVRGVELRQSSTPPIVTEAQEAALEVLAHAGDAEAFRAAIPRALEAARPVVERLRAGACASDELTVAIRVTRDLDAYRQMNHAHAAVRQLSRAGVTVPAGDTVRFVILDAESRDPRTRVREVRLSRGDEAYDAEAYERLLVRAIASLFLPFGYDEARVAGALGGEGRQARLAEFCRSGNAAFPGLPGHAAGLSVLGTEGGIPKRLLSRSR